ncbi:hypothetical protein CGCS363_v013992 [Colletotrichum siamense]|uniref:uncharacterized protein n=1 Tax=Colletotrichum siamense TaxID=690259 RepID=UPI0018722A54|nr:uncharacterized protein CGCS363_v013992 [Colletotrichum siamense]KAF5485005.1 hypothetical protein CGCS363_v013992 [Colletotrichum siamense]
MGAIWLSDVLRIRTPGCGNQRKLHRASNLELRRGYEALFGCQERYQKPCLRDSHSQSRSRWGVF